MQVEQASPIPEIDSDHPHYEIYQMAKQLLQRDSTRDSGINILWKLIDDTDCMQRICSWLIQQPGNCQFRDSWMRLDLNTYGDVIRRRLAQFNEDERRWSCNDCITADDPERLQVCLEVWGDHKVPKLFGDTIHGWSGNPKCAIFLAQTYGHRTDVREIAFEKVHQTHSV